MDNISLMALAMAASGGGGNNNEFLVRVTNYGSEIIPGYIEVTFDATIEEIVQQAQAGKLIRIMGMFPSSETDMFTIFPAVGILNLVSGSIPKFVFGGIAQSVGTLVQDQSDIIPSEIISVNLYVSVDPLDASNSWAGIKVSKFPQVVIDSLATLPQSYLDCLTNVPTTAPSSSDLVWSIYYNPTTEQFDWAEVKVPGPEPN